MSRAGAPCGPTWSGMACDGSRPGSRRPLPRRWWRVSPRGVPRRRSGFYVIGARSGLLLPPFLSRALDFPGGLGGEGMSNELRRIMSIDDPYLLLREVTTRLADAQQEVTELARLRRRVVQ